VGARKEDIAVVAVISDASKGALRENAREIVYASLARLKGRGAVIAR